MQASLTLNHTIYPVSSFEMTEAVSRAWRGVVVMTSSDPIDCEQMLTQYAALSWRDDSDHVREWVGVVLGCEVIRLVPEYAEYRWAIGSFLNTLKHTIIPYTTYCHQHTKAIVMQALHNAGAWSIVQNWCLSTRLTVHPMAVQVNESTYDFIARRCAMDSIVWYSHTQEGVDSITFVDDPSILRKWPVISMKADVQRKSHMCLSSREYMPPVSDWEDLPIDRLYRGVSSLGAGMFVPGVGMSDTRHFESYDAKGIDARVSIMTLLEHQRTLYRTQYITHYGKQCEDKLFYHHEAVFVALGHPWRGVSPARPKIPALLQGIVESHGTTPALDSQGQVYVKMLADKRVLDPCSASVGIPYCGSSFPLKPGTQVAIGCLYHNPDRPVILGVIASDHEKNVYKLVTPARHELRITERSAGFSLHLGNRDMGLTMSSNTQAQCALTSIGGMIVKAKGEYRMKSSGCWHSTVAGIALYRARLSYQIQAKDGDISLDAAKNMHIESKSHTAFQADKHLNRRVSGHVHARASRGASLSVQQGDMRVNIEGRCEFLVNKDLTISTRRRSLCMAAGKRGAALLLNEEGIVNLQGHALRFDCETLVLKGRMHIGAQPSLPVLPSMPSVLELIRSSPRVFSVCPTIKLRYPDPALSYIPGRHTIDYQYGGRQGKDCVWAVKQRISKVEVGQVLKGRVIGRDKTLRIWTTKTTQIICEQTGRPVACLTIDLSGVAPGHMIDILCLPPPIMINVRQDRASYDSNSRNILTQAELQYLKENGANATLFIHGFNIDYGEYGCHEKMSSWLRHHIPVKHLKQSDFAASTTPYTVRHEYNDLIASEDLKALLNVKSVHAKLVAHPLREEFYDKGGGDGAHTWCVNMEYNLNAQSGFLGDYRDPRYSRIIGVAWSGDVPVPYYMAAEHYADLAAARLVHLIRQLMSEKIKIHIVAHSLGNRVLLVLLHTLACDPAYRESIETAFLWQAAVPDTAIIDMKNIDTSIKQNWKTYYAIHAVKYMRVLYSRADISTLAVSYEAATKLGVSPACFVKQATYCPPDDNQALLIHGGARKPLTRRLQVRPPLGLRGEKGYDGDFIGIAEAFREKYKEKLSYIDLSDISLGHSYMKVKDYISSDDIYSQGFGHTEYRLGTYCL